jgi:hypothetical protein
VCAAKQVNGQGLDDGQHIVWMWEAIQDYSYALLGFLARSIDKLVVAEQGSLQAVSTLAL